MSKIGLGVGSANRAGDSHICLRQRRPTADSHCRSNAIAYAHSNPNRHTGDHASAIGLPSRFIGNVLRRFPPRLCQP